MDKRIDEIKKSLKSVEGFFGDEEGLFLYNKAKKISGMGAIVEIGSWKGRSTIWLAHASIDGSQSKVYAIDPHTGSPEHQELLGKVDTYAEFLSNIKRAGVDQVVVPIRKTSKEAAKEWKGGPIEFLWIDGAHEFEMVKQDFDLWSPYVLDGGVIAFHDTGIRKEVDGPKQFVEKQIFTSPHFKNVGFFETITVATKSRKTTFVDQLRNRRTLYIKKLYQRLRALKIPMPASLNKTIKILVNRATSI